MIFTWRIPALTEQMYRATVRAAGAPESDAGPEAAEWLPLLVARLEALGYTITPPARAA